MGCFNISGFFSHITIKAGDRIGAILCAQQTCTENIAMETTSMGLYPLMTPVYGRYNDEGGIEEMIESPSTEAFKNLTGIDFIKFIGMNHRNGGVSMNTKDNGNKFDNIPDYQAIIKKLIPKHCHTWTVEELERDIVKATADGDDEMLKHYLDAKEYEENKEDALLNTSFLIIYEHEDVLRQLIGTGYNHMNRTYAGDTYDAQKDYDTVAAYADACNGSIFNIHEINARLHENFMAATEKLNDGTLSGNDAEAYKQDIFSKYYERLDMSNAAEKAEACLFSDNIRYSELFGAVYKNQQVNHAELKNDILDLLYLNCGLYSLHGMYTPSSYAGQTVYYKEIMEMSNIFTKVMMGLYDVADDIGCEDDDI